MKYSLYKAYALMTKTKNRERINRKYALYLLLYAKECVEVSFMINGYCIS